MITNTHEPNDALNFLQPFNNNYAPLMVLHGDCLRGRIASQQALESTPALNEVKRFRPH